MPWFVLSYYSATFDLHSMDHLRVLNYCLDSSQHMKIPTVRNEEYGQAAAQWKIFQKDPGDHLILKLPEFRIHLRDMALKSKSTVFCLFAFVICFSLTVKYLAKNWIFHKKRRKYYRISSSSEHSPFQRMRFEISMMAPPLEI